MKNIRFGALVLFILACSLLNSDQLYSQNIRCVWDQGLLFPPSWVVDPNQFDPAFSNWDCDTDDFDIAYPHNFSPVGPFFDAVINDGSTVFVQPTLPIAISNLELVNDSSLILVDGTDFLLQDTGNSGIVLATSDIFLTNSGSGLATELFLDGNIRFRGGGQILMDDSNANVIRGNNAFNTNARLTLEDFTIEGAGNIGDNELLIHISENGLIRASGRNLLVIDPVNGGNSVFNNGTLQAAGGTLRLFDGGFDNTSGRIEALGFGTVEIVNATVTGGIFNSSGSGLIQARGGTVLAGLITNNARLQIPNVNIVYSGDLINNNQLLIGDGNLPGGLLYDQDMNLSGGGEVILGQSADNRMDAVFNTTGRLTNVNNTIRGSGKLGGRITNLGTVIANQSAPLIFQPQDIAGAGVNLGTMQATDGGTLQMHISTVDNSGGTIQAQNGGTLLLTGSATIDGGTVDVLDNSFIQLSSSSIDATVNNSSQGVIATIFGNDNLLTGTINNPIGGEIRLNQDTRLTLNQDGAYNNAGNIVLDGAGPLAGFAGTRLLIDNTVSLQGGGEVVLSNSVNNTIEGKTGNPGIDTLVNEDHRIHGSGHLGRNTLQMVNRGTIEANQTALDAEAWGTISIDPAGANGTFTNEGVVQAVGNGRLEFLNGIYENHSGIIQALNNGAIHVEQAVTIKGGTLATAGNGQVHINRDVTLDALLGLNLDANVRVNSPQGRLTLLGDISNRQSIQVDQANLRIQGEVNLNGGGTIQLTDHPDSHLSGFSNPNLDRLVNVDNTISGGGWISFFGITNQGTIRADGATNLRYDIPNAGFDNQGALQTTGTGGLDLIGGSFTTSGQVKIASGSRLFRDGDYVQTAGATTVNGTLEVPLNRTIEILGGSLGGSGDIIGEVVFTGDLAPGNSPGILNFNDQTTLQGLVAINLEIAGLRVDGALPDPASINTGTDAITTDYDQIHVFDQLQMFDDVKLDVQLLAGYDPTVGDFFDVVTADSANLIAGAEFQIESGAFQFDQALLTLFDPQTGSQRDVLRLTLVAIPEPSGGLILVLAAILGFGHRRTRTP